MSFTFPGPKASKFPVSYYDLLQLVASLCQHKKGFVCKGKGREAQYRSVKEEATADHRFKHLYVNTGYWEV